MATLIADDLLLLLLDDTTGRLTERTYIDQALGGALLIELALSGVVDVTPRKGFWSKGKVRLIGAERPADPQLGAAVATIGEKERSPQDLVNRLGRKLKATLLTRLSERGIVELKEDKVLGLFPRKRWPAVDSSREELLRRQLADALVRGIEPDERTAAIIAVLHAIGRAHKVVDREGLSAGQVKKRAKAISEGDWAAEAVRDAVAATQAAMTAVMVAAAASATAGS